MHASTSLLINDMKVASEIAAAGDEARTIGAAGSRLFPQARVEALYEMAFLRVFIAWEAFLEDTFAKCICGRLALPTGASLVHPTYSTIEDAERAMLGSSAFFPWADPSRVCDLAKRFVVSSPKSLGGGPHQQTLSSNMSRMKALKGIRNYVAHKSMKAKVDFEQSARVLSGTSHLGRSPGFFLRGKTSSSVIETRLNAYIEELGGLAKQIAE